MLIILRRISTDLPKQGPPLSKYFNVIGLALFCTPTFPLILPIVDAALKSSGKGRNHIRRLGSWPVLSQPSVYELCTAAGENPTTFWEAKALAEGHSDAIRRVKGVKTPNSIPSVDAVMDSKSAMRIYQGLYHAPKHLRGCFCSVGRWGGCKSRLGMTLSPCQTIFD